MAQGITPLTLEELALFNELLSSRFGLVFPEHKREILESRLEPRLRANHVHRYIDYYLLLQYDLQRELDPLTRAVTNNESYFFREAAQLEALQGQLVAELMAEGDAGKLRLLSAGCAAGEEPYSINIQVRTNCLGLQSKDFEIDAIDIDSERLEMARKGVYRPNALRTLNADQRARFFVAREADEFELRDTFRYGIRFQNGNIVDLSQFPARSFDIVFCRNVLIYFAEPALKLAIENFARLLRPGGLLFLGHSESIIGLTSLFQVERIEGCIAYRRTGD